MFDYSQLLQRFGLAIQERQRQEALLAQLQKAGGDEQAKILEQSIADGIQQRDAEILACQQEYDTVRNELTSTYDAELGALDSAHVQTLQRAERTAADDLKSLDRHRQDSEWVVTSVLDDNAEDSPVREFERFKTSLLKSREEQVAVWTTLDEEFTRICEQRGFSPGRPLEPETAPADKDDASALFAAATDRAAAHSRRLSHLWLPKLFVGLRPLLLMLALLAIVSGAVWMLVDPALVNFNVSSRSDTQWLGAVLAAGAIGSLLITAILYGVATSQAGHAFAEFYQSKSEAGWHHQKWLGFARDELARLQEECEAKQRLVARQRRDTLQKYEQTHASRVEEITMLRATQVSAENERYAVRHAELTEARRAALSAIEVEFQQRMQLLQIKWDAELASRREALKRQHSDRQRSQAELWMATKSGWERANQELSAEVRARGETSRTVAPAWELLTKGEWRPAKEIPHQLRFGHFDLHLEHCPGAISSDMRLAPRVTRHALPAELPFPEKSSLLLKYKSPSGKAPAVRLLQSLMLRLLTLIPPGKLRFTMIDPVGLGESFAGFMHLADFDELMVASRIWTEPSQIESRLADLTEHMENVLQKYLRNEFASIEEYNVSAGEVAEPYHFLIVTDFPAKFSEIAARRLHSIVQSGPRCGVYTLLSLDAAKQLPNNFNLPDLEAHMTVLDWHEQTSVEEPASAVLTTKPHDLRDPYRTQDDLTAHLALEQNRPVYVESAFYARDPALSLIPIQIDAPPAPEPFVELVRAVGEASKDARRVEVAFDRIAPKPDQFWTGDSRSQLEIPLGRAGATKLQTMKLGRGTSQHMLVAGKTGSGKSTFLHILITNLALHYSPDEVNFFLIDFKKGVEFKDYASLHLPHARVVAIESDREFGVSTLQRLDAILQERGELFRRHGVQDIAGFRNQNPKIPLPRILLVVDEFQEFFIEDDRLSQNASLLLDRLVRQGRAFGMHVVLGSQTLGGAYSLARSTLGQVAVRVALQCSEADAHLILSEENTAARLLTRPGEAIYNDANGMVEGNHPFQIAWLSDELREQYLRQLQQLTMRRRLAVEPPMVFEGNIPSDLSHNTKLLQLASEYSQRSEQVAAPMIWLGDAVEIKPGTTLTFHRQTGSNLLLVGQDAEAAQGVMSAAAIAAAVQSSPGIATPTVAILDGSPHETVESEFWRKLIDKLPIDIELSGPRQAPDIVRRLAAELEKREADTSVKHPTLLLFVFNLSKFRDLRKAEDDFGMSGFGGGDAKPAEPGKIFADILSRGPENGIHTVVWCDSYNNLDRWFSRQSLRDLEQRIAFQMNAADSSNLIDSPLAARLGTHRALLYREETGTTEKFRPYGLPTAAWLEELSRAISGTTDPAVAASLEEFSIL